MSTRKIFQNSIANKQGLSLALDSTLKTSHDMKVFGIGALAEFASMETYKYFVEQRYHFYKVMEDKLDSSEGRVRPIWLKFESDLRQTPCLVKDLASIGISNTSLLNPSKATDAYCRDIQNADDDRLIGHFYCRYFADLFGGSMLGKPTSLALGVEPPSFYKFGSNVEDDRAAYIERIYEEINRAGDSMDENTRLSVIEEAKLSFDHNAAIIKDRGLQIIGQAALGLFNLSGGAMKSYLSIRST